MKVSGIKKRRSILLTRGLSLLLCIALFFTSIPFDQADAAVTVKKFIKADPQVFVPSAGEKATITWNFETDHNFNIMVMDGEEIITYLAKDKKYAGNYKTHEITWDGKDKNGKVVNEGTYTIVVEPQEAAYKKYKSVTNVTVLDNSNKEIGLSTKLSGSTFIIYGKGGKKQGVTKVTLSVLKDGSANSTINATIEDNLWYAKFPMTIYSLYNAEATIKSSSGTKTSNISAVRHTYRVSDRLTYLASAYYGDYTRDDKIISDNKLKGKYNNEGKLIGKNILIINPSQKVQQEIKKDSTTTKQHLGVIDQLQRTALSNPVSLSMGNNFYENDDITIDGHNPLTFSRTYNSLGHNFSEFGVNWTNSYTYFLQETGSSIAIQFPDGHIEYYTKQNDDTYKAADGLVRKLKVNSDKSYTLIIDGNQIYEFNSDGSLKTIKDLNGNATELTYTNGMLTKVENLCGYFNFTYNKNGTIKTIVDSGNRSISYSYTDGLVSIFKDVNGYETNYSYDTSNRLNKVVSPEQVPLLKVKYDSSDRVTSKTVEGSTYTYSYDDTGRKITCKEPNGNKITFHYTKDYRIESEEYSDGTINYYYKDISKSTKSLKVNVTDQKLDEKSVKSSKSFAQLGDNTKTVDLSLKTHNLNIATGSTTNNTLYPQFLIKNNGKNTINLSDITLRYYYTIDGEKPQNFWCDWSSAGTGNVTGKFVKLSTPTSTADYYLELGFTSAAGTLKTGKTVETHVRIAKNDWSNFIPGNDYSQNLASDFTSFDKVDMYYKGELVWGKGSIDSSTDIDNNQTKDKEDPTTKDVPKGTNTLKLQMYNTGNSGTSTNTIHPMMRLINTGKNMVKLSDVTIRYYYTADDDKPQNFWCDWSSAGQQNVKGTFHKLEQATTGADTYLELGFKEDAGYLNISSQADIHVRIAKNDWSNYDITNDYSHRSAESFADWNKVDVFVKGEKVWGEGVVPGDVVEESSEEYIEYADTTFTPVRVEMFNTKTEKSSNFLSPRFRIYNTDTDAIKLSDINIVYFYTTDGPEKQIFEADWAGIGSKFKNSIDKDNVICEFTEVGDDNLSTNCAANISFNRNDLIIEPGDYLELHTRIHRESWTDYVQSNDFSLNSESSTYEEWNKIAVFVSGKWAFGSLPMTYAAVIDPDPETNNIPVDIHNSYGSNTDKSGNASYYTYDDNGNITSKTDAMGNKTEYTYNEFNQITSIIDPLGYKTTYEYDSKGNCISETDAMGNKTRYSYNSFGCLTKTEMPDGSIETRTYDSKGNVLTVTDAANNTITYQYDKLNQVIKFIDANGNSESYEYTKAGEIQKLVDALGGTNKTEYNKGGQAVKVTNQNGNSTQYKYDAETGKLIQVMDALSGIETYQYDNMGNLTTETAADGSKTTYEYDLFGNVKSVTDREGSKTTYSYDVNGNVVQEKNALGNIIKYSYDKLNRLTSVTDEENNTTSYVYDGVGRVTSEKQANGGVIAYEYDGNGNMIQVKDSLGNVTKQRFNKLGLLSTMIDGEGNKTSFEYDKVGRQIKVIDPMGGINSWEYDKNGNLIKEIDADGNSVTYQYDKLNRISKITDALGYDTDYKYDGLGNVTEETDARGNKTKYTYDAKNNLVEIKDALGKLIKYRYNKNGNLQEKEDAKGYIAKYKYSSLGNLTKVEDALGNTTEYSFDKVGNLTKETRIGATSASNQTTNYKYDKCGNLTLITDPIGQTVSYEYDNMGQLVKETAKDSTSIVYQYDLVGNLVNKTYSDRRSVNYTYDSNYRLESMTDWTGTTTYQYDSNGRKLKVTDSNNQTIQYTWTKSGQKKSMIYPDGKSVQYEYDKAGNRIKVTDTKNGTNTFNYNSLNQMTGKQMANGSESSYEYNALGQLTKRTEKVNGTTKCTYNYQYDGNGNRSKVNVVKGQNTKTISYTYDALNQLVKVVDGSTTRTYQYDEFNNRITKTETGKEKITYTYNDLNQLIQEKQGSTTKSYQFDKRGNLITKKLNGTTSASYTYDSTNMLTKVNNLSNGLITEYVYDGDNNRIQKTEQNNNHVSGKVNYVIDTESLYKDIIASNNTLTGEVSDFVYGKGLLSVDTSNKISYYRIDDMDTVEEIQDSNGTVQSTLEYDEFGNVTTQDNIKVNGNIFSYTGYVFEDNISLYYAKARYYNPDQGRFVSEDSYRGEINNPISLNLYTYCENNPIANTDPSGNYTLVLAAEVLLILVLASGVICYVHYCYYATPECKRAIREGAVAIYKGTIIAGKAITKAAKSAVKRIQNGAIWAGEKVVDGAVWIKDKTTNAWKSFTKLFSKDKSKSSTKSRKGAEKTKVKDKAEKKGLPTEGEIQFEPKGNEVKYNNEKGGYVDKDGNIWRKGPYHGDPNKGYSYEWDVELSSKGVNKWGKYLKPGKNYINVRPDGQISH